MKEKLKKYGSFLLSVSVVAWLSNYFYEAFKIPSILDRILYFISKFFSSFMDTAVGKAIHTSEFPYLKLAFVIAIFYSNVINFISSIKNKKYKSKWLISYLSVAAILTVLLSISFITDMVMYHTIVPSVKNHIEILEPYITEEKYTLMKSDYYRISTYDDYTEMRTEIERIMHENKLDSSQVLYQPN